mgnify:CR=1 FL=1
MAKLTKRQKKINEMLADFTQPTSALEAIKKLQEIAEATSKFDETLEVHMRYNQYHLQPVNLRCYCNNNCSS